jgi:Uma2 family endonuclease
VTAILENPAVRDLVLPISVEQDHKLSEAGIIPEKTELLRGYIIERKTKSPLHTWIVGQLIEWFEARVGPQPYVRKEEPLTLDISEPEPDIAIVDGNRHDYQNAHPRTARLVIEVAISSEDVDREKGDDYARAGVSEYWIVLPEEDTIEVFRDPSPMGYADHQRCTFGDSIRLDALGQLVFPVDHIRRSGT